MEIHFRNPEFVPGELRKACVEIKTYSSGSGYPEGHFSPVIAVPKLVLKMVWAVASAALITFAIFLRFRQPRPTFLFIAKLRKVREPFQPSITTIVQRVSERALCSIANAKCISNKL